MTEGYAQIAPDSTGDKIRTNEIEVGENTVAMQIINVADAAGNILGDAAAPISVSDFLTSDITYQDGDVFYICRGLPGAVLTDADWQVKRVDTADPIRTTWADGNTNFDNVATDLVTVKAMNYI